MKIITPIAIIFLMTTSLLSQRLYIEPDFGFYRPSENTYIDSLVFYPDTDSMYVRDHYFKFGVSPRYGMNIGLLFPNDMQIYFGYKSWKSDHVNTIFESYSIGVKESAFLLESNLGIRVGVEYIISKMYNTLDLPVWKLYSKGKGTALEAGIIYKITDRIILFTGFDYLSPKIYIYKILKEGPEIIMRKQGNIKMDGFSLKMNITFVLSAPIKFENHRLLTEF